MLTEELETSQLVDNVALTQTGFLLLKIGFVLEFLQTVCVQVVFGARKCFFGSVSEEKQSGCEVEDAAAHVKLISEVLLCFLIGSENSQSKCSPLYNLQTCKR